MRTTKQKLQIALNFVLYAGFALVVVAFTYAQFSAALFPGGRP